LVGTFLLLLNLKFYFKFRFIDNVPPDRPLRAVFPHKVLQ
jgi:hypothetical protein